MTVCLLMEPVVDVAGHLKMVVEGLVVLPQTVLVAGVAALRQMVLAVGDSLWKRKDL
jgi:hypothetical protein